MSNIVDKHEETIKRLTKVGATMNAFGEPLPPPKDKLVTNCDDISKWRGKESCDTCPNPCPESEE